MATAVTSTVSAAIQPQHQRVDAGDAEIGEPAPRLQTLSRRFGRMSSIAAMSRNTAANTRSLINPSLVAEKTVHARRLAGSDEHSDQSMVLPARLKPTAGHHETERGELDEGERLAEIGKPIIAVSAVPTPDQMA